MTTPTAPPATTLPTLTTPRLTLRPWRLDDEADVDAFFAIQGDPRVIWWGHARDKAAARAVMHNRAVKDEPPRLGTWAIEEAGVVVGNGLLIRSELGVEIGWHVRRDAQGRGVATEAALALVDHAWRVGFDVVVAAIVPVNVPSQRVAQKIGCVVEGSCVKANLFHDCWVLRRPGARVDRAAIDVDAGPDDVFAAFADGAQYIRWLPPNDMEGRLLRWDFRAGGDYAVELVYADDTVGKSTAKSDIARGSFVVVDDGARIVQTAVFDGDDPAFQGTMRLTWTFTPTASGTRVEVAASDVPAGISAEDHAAGLTATLENLKRHLET